MTKAFTPFHCLFNAFLIVIHYTHRWPSIQPPHLHQLRMQPATIHVSAMWCWFVCKRFRCQIKCNNAIHIRCMSHRYIFIIMSDANVWLWFHGKSGCELRCVCIINVMWHYHHSFGLEFCCCCCCLSVVNVYYTVGCCLSVTDVAIQKRYAFGARASHPKKNPLKQMSVLLLLFLPVDSLQMDIH